MSVWPEYWKYTLMVRILVLLLIASVWSISIPDARAMVTPPSGQTDSPGSPVHISSNSDDATFEQMQTRYKQLLLLHQLQGPTGWAWFASLPEHRLIVFYGNPLAPVMGPIGRYSDQELISRLRQQAQVYQDLDPSHPIVPAIDYVTPLAQPVPMNDNSWTYRMPDSSIEHYVNLARDNHVLFFFDMQIGHSTIQKEVQNLWPYLQDPWVHLSLDPEFDMPPGGVPSQVFGRMYASEINWVITQLAQLVREHSLPPKTLIIHQFLTQMLPDWQNIKVQPGVHVITCVDGFGLPGAKIDDYRMFNHDQHIQYPGMKLFYDLDRPLMSPSDVLALRPSPLMVMYQ